MFNWQKFCSVWQRVRYYLIFLAALWLSLGIPGCSFSPPNSQTVSSPNPTQINPTAQRFDGVTINVITHDEAIHTGIQRRIAGFEALTGAKVNLTGVPFKNLYTILENNWSGKNSKYDMAVILPQWLIDFIDASYLEDLTARVKTDAALRWEDIAPIFRNVSATYKGRIYSIPLDGDFHMVYYRSDLLKEPGLTPPETWEQYLAIAKRFHGKDLNGDGKPDYGSCISKRAHENSTSMLISIATPFLQSLGTAQGAFFDPDTMKPLVNNPGFAKAMDIYKQTMDYGVPHDENLGGSKARELFITGRCALTIDWGDVGPLSIDRSVSKVMNKVGAVITPGTTQVLDRKTNQLVACDKFTCPYAIDGVNHAPYAANVGWTGVVYAKAAANVKDAAYSFLSYMSQPAQSNVDVTIGTTGFNPYRISQFENSDPWIKAGLSSEVANNYLGAIGVSLNSSNIVLNLSIPHNQQYQFEVLDAVVSKFLVKKITKEEAMQQIAQGWEQITNQVGRESQRAAYRASLGL
ncbi:ABC transporter substrate-binding protein [Nostoc sp. 'Peltigera membranacea cyanobiont' 213]|uniref:ABC transporter substrate-binding protein n=1 Tax=Nostoc sp. 'Peltigera membranacea cyanobiont' 213 TaxID=2014530 RepID=UPI000B95510C|nr:extracellular solute-binding protein [Nostoc sp. 'Peltigera membranacea cyanobiont' 213]OYD87561.1 ABC transporter substrate-binding protein [Nostoc sp. 'Peltigera membranacea cyanobiont' 213]